MDDSEPVQRAYTLVGIDVGVTNFAFCKIAVDGPKTMIIDLGKFDLAMFDGCRDARCNIQRHAKDACSRVQHLIKMHRRIFECDVIAIEQQPPVGLKDIEQTLALLAERNGLKVVLCSPRAMQAHYRIGSLNYDERKQWAEDRLESQIEDLAEYMIYDRKHDIADAYAIACYTEYTRRQEYEKKREQWLRKKRLSSAVMPNGAPVKEFLQQFVYVPQHERPDAKATEASAVIF